MAKRKGKKLTSTLTWKAAQGAIRLLFQGLLKSCPLLFFAAICSGIFWGIREDLYADPGFRIETLEIVPPGALPISTIKELERLFLHQSLFKISLSTIAETVQKNAGVREARAVRIFPKVLRIEVIARNPFLQIALQAQGPYYAADEEGVLLAKSFTRDPNLLLVEAVDSKGIQPVPGERLRLSGLKEVRELVRAFWDHPLARSEKIERVRIDHLGSLSLVLKEGPELRFGRYPKKRFNALGALSPLLKGADRSKIIYIDLQYGDLIVKKK